MIGSLLSSLFGGQKEEETLQVDDKLALAVLLVRAGYADGEYCGAEQDRTERILAAWFDLSPAEVKELRIEAEQVEADVVDNVSFTRVLKEIVPFDEREAVVEALWEIVLADQSRTVARTALCGWRPSSWGSMTVTAHWRARESLREWNDCQPPDVRPSGVGLGN